MDNPPPQPPPPEQLLKKIQELEAGHAHLKKEMSKLILHGTIGPGPELGHVGNQSSHFVLPQRSRLGDPRRSGREIEHPAINFTTKQYVNILQSMGMSIHIIDTNGRLSYWRVLFDDGRAVGEALDETVCVEDTCQGLTLGTGQRWRRTTGQEIYSPLLLVFTHEASEKWNVSHVTNATTMDPAYSLPPNVAVITLQELDDGMVLLRLAHLYETGEDSEYSTKVKVELKKMFFKKTSVTDTSLSANQEKSEMKKMNWRVEGDGPPQPTTTRGGPIDESTLIVELSPMEIRTFLVKF